MQQEDEKTHVVSLLSWMQRRDVSVVENAQKYFVAANRIVA
jgi:hypothetical protein